MSADNTLATLQLKDGYRIADIPVIWDGEEEALFSPYIKADFSASDHYATEQEADTAEERILEQYDKGQQVLEYGCSSYQLDMTWAEYLAAGDHPRVECPVCTYAVKAVSPLSDETPDLLACDDCINGSSF